jgi:pterin-4a-carbinolamine dehydratase
MNWDKYTFDGMLSSEPHRNYNMVGSTSLAVILCPDLFIALAFYSALWQTMGTLTRNPSIDDWICFAGVSEKTARATMKIGKATGWIFDCESMEYPRRFKRWFVRFPAFIAHVHYAANDYNHPPSKLMQYAWAIAMYFGATAKSQDAIIQSWVMRRSYRRSQLRSKICDIAAAYYDSKPRDLNQTYLDYCQLQDHPLVGAFPK